MDDPHLKDAKKRIEDEQSEFLMLPWEPPEGYVFSKPPFTFGGSDDRDQDR